MVFYVIALSLALAALLAWLLSQYEQKRTAALQAVATSLGASFRPEATAEDKTLLAQSHLGSLGYGSRMTNVMETTRTGDLSITLFDYYYKTGSGRESRSWYQTVSRMQAPMLSLPQFQLYPESIFAKIAQAFGYRDIDFPEFPEFSRMYMVRGADEAAVRRVFTPALLQFCEQHRGISLEAALDRLLFFRVNYPVKPEALTTFVDDGKRVMALLFEATQPVAA